MLIVFFISFWFIFLIGAVMKTYNLELVANMPVFTNTETSKGLSDKIFSLDDGTTTAKALTPDPHDPEWVVQRLK